MPRGGGFGGGFHGGGSFRSSGGFRSSFRGSSINFRSKSFGSTSRPFGRTGSTRTVRSSSINKAGYRSHASHRHYHYNPYYRHYYGYRYGYGYGYGYPRSRFWGYGYRRWYSPFRLFNTICFIIILLLIVLPMLGVLISYPFSSANSTGEINYRSTESLSFNEYWYEYEEMKAGGQITFAMQSYEPVSFAIADHPFEDFPTEKVQYNYEENNYVLESKYYSYYQIFLTAGSKLTYSMTSTGPVQFYIMDGENLNEWNYDNYYDAYVEKNDITFASGTIIADETKDYYIVIWNDGGNQVTFDISGTYEAIGKIDFSDSIYYEENTTDISTQTITVPNDGDWYFFIYFDPTQSDAGATTITFDVTFNTGITSVDRWEAIRPFLFVILIFALIMIVIGVSYNKTHKNKENNKQQQTIQSNTVDLSSNSLSNNTKYNGSGVTITDTRQITPETSIQTTSTPISPTSTIGIKKETTFNTDEKGKANSTITTIKPLSPSLEKEFNSSSTTASSLIDQLTSSNYLKCLRCGKNLKPGMRFCPNCGKPVEGRSLGETTKTTLYKKKYCGECGSEVQPGFRYCENCGAELDNNY